MPRNMFETIDMVNNDNNDGTIPIYIIEEDIANVSTSSFSVNYTVNDTFRADQRIMFNCTIRDQFYNVRNQSYYTSEDTMSATVYYLNDHTQLYVNESYNVFLP
jgi:hypothetical protein